MPVRQASPSTTLSRPQSEIGDSQVSCKQLLIAPLLQVSPSVTVKPRDLPRRGFYSLWYVQFRAAAVHQATLVVKTSAEQGLQQGRLHKLVHVLHVIQ